MELEIELRKLKRSGYVPMVLAGSILSTLVPILQVMIRKEYFLKQTSGVMEGLLQTSWNMMAMIQSIVNVLGACILYHIEFADRGYLKMAVLPRKKGNMHWYKWLILFLSNLCILLMQTFFFAVCMQIWFSQMSGWTTLLMRQIGFSILVSIPCSLILLLAASCTTNMWMSLGFGIVAIFLASLIPCTNPAAACYPFSLAYVLLHQCHLDLVQLIKIIAIESVAAVFVSGLILKKRGCEA